MTDTLVPETTHIVIDTGPHVAQARVKPVEVMQRVTSQLGGLQGLRLLRRLMVSGQLTLVAPRYAFHMTFLCTLFCTKPSAGSVFCIKTDLLFCMKHSSCASDNDVALRKL